MKSRTDLCGRCSAAEVSHAEWRIGLLRNLLVQRPQQGRGRLRTCQGPGPELLHDPRAGFGVAWEFVPIQVMIWDGEFPLAVEVVAEADPPKRVSCQVYPWRERAEREYAAAELHTTTWTPVATADPYAGQPLVIHVQCSGRRSPLGRELAWNQFDHLVVVAEWPDGRRAAKLVPTPDRRGPRSVRVTFP